MRRESVWNWLAGGLVGLTAWRALRDRFPRYAFRDKTVLLTGGSRGLGLVLARQLAAQGARLALVARDRAELERAARELRARGATVGIFECDIRDPRSVDAMVREVVAGLGPIDVVLNNAGTIQVGPVHTMTAEDYQDALNTHFWGPFHLLQATLPDMRRRRSGRIVNISSIGGKIAVPHLMPYTASKFALTGFSEGLGSELAKDGIVVTTVCPGLMRTGSPPHVLVKGNHQAEYAWFAISDSLPLLTLSAERPARQILRACRRGDREVILGMPYRLARRMHGLFPGATVRLMGWVNRLLPDSRQKTALPGRESGSAWTASPLTALTRKAAVKNNELTETAPRQSA